MPGVPRWRREAETLVAAELGGDTEAAWIAWDALRASRVDSATPLVVSVVGHAPSPQERAEVLGALAARTPAGTRLVVVDHNRPRRLAAALRALLGPPRVRGGSPAVRWRRLADPTARATQAAGFRVDRLRLVADERVQVVLATREHSSAGDDRDDVDGTQRSRDPLRDRVGGPQPVRSAPTTE
ncbi:MAG: hypothetical protein IT293_20280 [Deltaproteobacteria bacterium]|nr:hypothetical protein [Deltaproteobacteria bacterium]